MSSHETAPPLTGGTLPVELEVLSSLAVTVLNEHTDQAGRCAVCGSAWPCESVLLADHNLAML